MMGALYPEEACEQAIKIADIAVQAASIGIKNAPILSSSQLNLIGLAEESLKFAFDQLYHTRYIEPKKEIDSLQHAAPQREEEHASNKKVNKKV